MMKKQIPSVMLAWIAAAVATASAADAPQPTGQPAEAVNRAETADAARTRESISNFSKLAQEAAGKGNLELAETYYNKLLDLNAPEEEKKAALWQMATMYQKNRVFSKAIAVYEKANELFPADPKTPEMLLKVGLIYRETGAYQMAISKFYAVLDSTLKIDRRDFDAYKALTQQAQFEIAETYFLAGNYEEADKFFSMLKRLDLSHEDKARAEFKSIYCRFLLKDYPGVISSARIFVRDFPDTKYVPECRYILASALRSLDRAQEATDEVLALLRAEKPKEKADPENWVYWQKKTGNQIANDLYQQGEFIKALSIYQSLAKLDGAPDWQLPVVYQIGLCFERLRLLPRALEAYSFILDQCKKTEAGGAALSSSLQTLREMAQWRSDKVSWMQDTDFQLQSLLHGKELPADPVSTGTQ